jgi:hypothetical protein
MQRQELPMLAQGTKKCIWLVAVFMQNHISSMFLRDHDALRVEGSPTEPLGHVYIASTSTGQLFLLIISIGVEADDS